MFATQNLKEYNTFGFNVNASRFVNLESISQLQKVLGHLSAHKCPLRILGGGSNVLLTKSISEPLLHINLKGIGIVSESDKELVVKAQAGENWHQFVLWCVENDFGGLENLSLIPGKVGASPIQNIGAYGVEVKDRIVEVETVNIATGEIKIWKNQECEFAYRHSIFKGAEKNKWIITAVSFKLSKQQHQFITHYGSVNQELEKMGQNQPSIKAISDAVIAIRQSKLPDPAEIGNSGSFFKNPIISEQEAEALQKKFETIPVYPAQAGYKKLAAGWLIDQAGWKGYTEGAFGVHKKQALVLVNYGEAKGSDVYHLSERIVKDVKEKFGVELEREVNVW